MKLTLAQPLADKIAATMAPYAARVVVAGSIRRRKPEVKDVEIVAIPNYGEPDDLLGEHRPNLLADWADKMQREGRIQWIKPGTSDIIPWPINPDGRYWRGWLVQAKIKLDLFLAQPENFGAILMIRTGDADYSTQMVTLARDRGHYFAEGKLINTKGQHVPTFEEADVYDASGEQYVDPWERRAVDTRLNGLR
jgi:DNA polymerase/3'-5' exonuclease PolX